MMRYREEVVPGHKGADVERTRINRILRTEAFVDKWLAALCTEDLQDFITDRLTEVAPATVDRELDVISQVIRYSSDVWKIAAFESPFVGLRRPKYFNERDRRLSHDEEARLLAAARNDENRYIEPAIILALETAARRGELLAITRGDVNLEERYALLKETKNGRSRKVPLSKRAISVITELMADCIVDDEPLLKLSANALKIAFFRRVVPASGVMDVHFHDLRHEAISRLAESSEFQLIELQAISGHRDTRMLLRYAHLCSGNLADKMDNVASERTTKTYFHRGRRRHVESVEPVLAPIPPTTKLVAAGERPLSGNVIQLFGPRPPQSPAR
jgi:integrase